MWDPGMTHWMTVTDIALPGATERPGGSKWSNHRLDCAKLAGIRVRPPGGRLDFRSKHVISISTMQYMTFYVIPNIATVMRYKNNNDNNSDSDNDNNNNNNSNHDNNNNNNSCKIVISNNDNNNNHMRMIITKITMIIIIAIITIIVITINDNNNNNDSDNDNDSDDDNNNEFDSNDNDNDDKNDSHSNSHCLFICLETSQRFFLSFPMMFQALLGL